MPELARDPNEQCTYLDPSTRPPERRCLNRATNGGTLRTCEGPHRFTVDEPVRGRCIAIGGGPHDRCLNPSTGPEYPLVATSSYCTGPHRFAPGVDKVEGWTREIRQHNAMEWATAAFGVEQSCNTAQRALRLLEEAVELYQACVHTVGRGDARARAHDLIEYVFGRPVGEIGQEIGGVSVCLLVLAEAANLSADHLEVMELHRVLSKPVAEFTKRNAAKNAAGFLATTTPAALKFDGYAERTHQPLADVLPKEINRSTDGECALITAAWHHYLAYEASKDDTDHHLRMSLGGLAVAARAWCAAHPNDHRTPTEIAQGVTDKNPTRMHTIQPDGSVPTLGFPAETLRSMERALQLEHENLQDMRKQRDEALDKVGQLTLANLTLQRPRPPATTRELHGTTKHHAFAETICDLMYEKLSVCDMNVYGTSEKLDRCVVANMLADTIVEDGWVRVERSAAEAAGPHVFKECVTCAAKPGSPTLCVSCIQNRQTIAWYVEHLRGATTTLQRVEQNNELGRLIAAVDAPVPMIMHCPGCHQRHIDVAFFADYPHHTHACQHCGFTWRPAVVPTVGVQFLPGFKDEEK